VNNERPAPDNSPLARLPVALTVLDHLLVAEDDGSDGRVVVLAL
jgi:hypothetical protein